MQIGDCGLQDCAPSRLWSVRRASTLTARDRSRINPIVLEQRQREIAAGAPPAAACRRSAGRTGAGRRSSRSAAAAVGGSAAAGIGGRHARRRPTTISSDSLRLIADLWYARLVDRTPFGMMPRERLAGAARACSGRWVSCSREAGARASTRGCRRCRRSSTALIRAASGQGEASDAAIDLALRVADAAASGPSDDRPGALSGAPGPTAGQSGPASWSRRPGHRRSPIQRPDPVRAAAGLRGLQRRRRRGRRRHRRVPDPAHRGRRLQSSQRHDPRSGVLDAHADLAWLERAVARGARLGRRAWRPSSATAPRWGRRIDSLRRDRAAPVGRRPHGERDGAGTARRSPIAGGFAVSLSAGSRARSCSSRGRRAAACLRRGRSTRCAPSR